ncbi:hypothetical protein BD289DRAFT_272328 [Coniella lustricola]|uniref:Uncharacterized protein n=1 Tax=Coniella lustricola TaxID=2025994 RepID=A0A2T3AKT1_9PEZI|nr:hypothetical protein BD289DRAFT_272328 [Coniella lustricola]
MKTHSSHPVNLNVPQSSHDALSSRARSFPGHQHAASKAQGHWRSNREQWLLSHLAIPYQAMIIPGSSTIPGTVSGLLSPPCGGHWRGSYAPTTRKTNSCLSPWANASSLQQGPGPVARRPDTEVDPKILMGIVLVKRKKERGGGEGERGSGSSHLLARRTIQARLPVSIAFLWQRTGAASYSTPQLVQRCDVQDRGLRMRLADWGLTTTITTTTKTHKSFWQHGGARGAGA